MAQAPDPELPELDWFGNPLGPHEGGVRPPVPCPLCGAPFTGQAELAAHVAADHDVKLRAGRSADRPPRTSHLQSWWRSLGYLPLWFVLPLTAGTAALAYSIVRPIGTWFAVYAAVLASLPLVLVLSHRVFGPKRGR
ncbi:MAG: hypothetical protein ACXWCM_14785 [Acidimicrobiales bacterium]